MSATTLSTEKALAWARSMVGVAIYPQGRCLNFVWRAYGSVSSVGDAVGHLGSAAGAWSVAKKKHLGDRNVPAGFWGYLGHSPTRTDYNNQFGDAILSIGGGLFICTDAVGARVGIMTLAAREAQTRRPFEGWAEDLGNHTIISPANKAAKEAAARRAAAKAKAKRAARLLALKKRDDMLYIGSKETGNIYEELPSGTILRHRDSWSKRKVVAAHGYQPQMLSGKAVNEIIKERAAAREKAYAQQRKALGIAGLAADINDIQADVADLVAGENSEPSAADAA